ncbi:hypothetical protein CHGG_05130 [Chaetomium globosum CBS 148.51]|uniref:DNA mismatch repair protein HSM3 N-terminal domain-containing protein n=1 Tax=Chaetomium globosum (strain ATCC 6205 / CBS 148.51 / DSM 1962 / NBRC 6347 / NRRL 1970) TaxID=306901 RepID=Q2GZB6_CHAGB|nr:uncharacterized protein CHGG_05130 [Chaetomium globosum CBS 148.51]EAQ88511.1 hypothetical protein CHGG_05130 [Chaetomium globosum CBS 148.51]
METTPITGLDEFDKHLDDLIQDPSLTLNPKLFDDIELQLTESNILPLIPRFLPRLTTVLKQYTEDPTAIVNLTIKLLQPVPFEDVFSLAQTQELITALESPAPAANLLGIAILRKAAAAPRHISFLCTHPDLVAAFIRCWLVSPQVEVGHRGTKVLGDLLDIDSAQAPPPPPTRPIDPDTMLSIRREPGHGALWDLLFRNRPMYTLLLDLISGHHPDMLANPAQVSLAQDRVLRLLPRLASIDFPTVSRSDILPPSPASPPQRPRQRRSGRERGGGDGGEWVDTIPTTAARPAARRGPAAVRGAAAGAAVGRAAAHGAGGFLRDTGGAAARDGAVGLEAGDAAGGGGGGGCRGRGSAEGAAGAAGSDGGGGGGGFEALGGGSVAGGGGAGGGAVREGVLT